MQTQVKPSTLPINLDVAVAMSATAPTLSEEKNNVPCPKAARHVHVLRSLRRPTANVARESGLVSSRCGQCSGSAILANNLRLGIGKNTAKNLAITGFGGNTRSQNTNNLARKINLRKILNAPIASRDFLDKITFVNLERPVVQPQSDTPVSFSQAQPPHPFKVDTTERQDVSGFFTYFNPEDKNDEQEKESLSTVGDVLR